MNADITDQKKWFDMIVSGEKERGVQRNQAILRQQIYECVRVPAGRRTDGIWRGSAGRNPEAVAGTSSIQKWILEGLSGNCLQMHFAIWRR